MTGEFVFDDRIYITENASIRSLWPLSQSLWAASNTPVAARPVINFSFALNYAFHGLNVFGYHLTNVILHLVNTALLWALIHRTLSKLQWVTPWREAPYDIAFTVSLLWAFHPLQTETASYVTQRSELLMSFFLLVTLISSRLAWESRSVSTKTSWQFVCVAACFFGMASKEVMVVAPVLVVLFDLTTLNQSFAILGRRRWPLYVSLGATWVVLGLLLSTNPRSQTIGFNLSYSVSEYITTQFWAIARYLQLALFPVGMCADYGEIRIHDLEL